MELQELTAAQAVEDMRAGRLSSEELVSACLTRIRSLEDRIQAWAFLDADHALAQARRADEIRRAGKAFGALHGIPVGIKDIIDTQDMPTENGTVLHQGRRPRNDATVVALLRQAGAVILGKTVTTELAYYAPGKTTNPHDPRRTPGGSSSGSAAAVAAGMVPLALGTQTNGSVLRPASFCGVFGFKPTFGLISRHGVLRQSRALDQIGVFARSVEDVALLATNLAAYDDNDPDLRPQVRPDLLRAVAQDPPMPPRFAFVKTPMWSAAEPDTQAGFAELVERLGDHVHELTLPELFSDAVAWHRAIMEADLAHSFELEYERGRNQLSAQMREAIERGRGISAVEYNRALDRIPLLNELLEQIFFDFDAIITPPTAGEAPLGLDHTGNPIFCTLWTLSGTPAVSLPLLTGSHGMPIGVQVVGARGDDARLLRSARWLIGFLRAGSRAVSHQRAAGGRKS